MLFKKKNPETAAPEASGSGGFLSVPQPGPCFEKLDSLLSANKKGKGAVIKLHMENFKSFNDMFGFHFGELMLKEIVGFLKQRKGAQLYRTAGVEFVLILENANHAAALSIAEEIGQRFAESWHINGLDCMCSINMALAYYPGNAESSAEIMQDLAHAINESERIGQNRLVVFGEDLKQKILRKNSIALQIPSALEDGSMELRYRPSYYAAAKRFTRADCYMRLHNAQFGIVHSDELVPIAEESGQINAVTLFVIERTCKLIAELIAADKDFETIAVPVSPIQFMQERFVDDVRDIIERAGVPASRLAMEVADSVAITAFTNALVRINELADLGIEIILTDFGTGNSSLTGILDLPVKAVKLDRLFIWQLENDPRVPPLAEGLVYISKKLGLKLVAEGVETQTQVRLLERFGCEYEQGFYYSPTMSVSELMDAFETKTKK